MTQNCAICTKEITDKKNRIFANVDAVVQACHLWPCIEDLQLDARIEFKEKMRTYEIY